MRHIGFLFTISLLATTVAHAESLRTYAEPGGLHVVVGDLVSTASYRALFATGATTKSLALDASGEAWAFPADPTPRLLVVTILRDNEPILSETITTGDPAVLLDDAATSVALLVLAQQREAVLDKFKGTSRAAVEAAFDAARPDILSVLRLVGRQKYFAAAQNESSELTIKAARLDNKLKTAEGVR